MGHATGKVDVNDGLGHTFLGLVELLGAMRLHLEELEQTQAKAPNEADLHEFPAGGVLRQPTATFPAL